MAYSDAGGFFKSIVANEGDTPLVNYNFMLRVEGLVDVPCRAVRVFQKENEFEYIQEGGLNDYVHMRRKPITKPFTFQVERYVGIEMLDPMSNGTEFMLPLILFVNRTPLKDWSSVAPTNFSRVYTFTGAVVMSKEFGELQADKSGLLVETTTIGYREMMCIDNPAFDSSTLPKWSFNTGGVSEGYRTIVDYKGNNQSLNKREKYTKAEKTKAEHEAMGDERRWQFKEDGKKGAYIPIKKTTPGKDGEPDVTSNNYLGNEKKNRAEDWSTPAKQEGVPSAGDVRYDIWDMGNEGHRKSPIHAKVPAGQRSKEDAIIAGDKDRWKYKEDGKPGAYISIGQNYKGNEKFHQGKNRSDSKSKNTEYAEKHAWAFKEGGSKGEYVPIGENFAGNGKVNHPKKLWDDKTKKQNEAYAAERAWGFDGGGKDGKYVDIGTKYKGNGKSNHEGVKWSDSKSDHQDMADKRAWGFSKDGAPGAYVPIGDDFKGNGKSNHEEKRFPSSSKEENEKSARKYPPTESHAKKPGGGKQKPRKYPDTKSAKEPPKGKGQKARSYPQTRSAAQREGAAGSAQPRVYPPTRSSIDPPNKGKQEGRLYPPTRSAARVDKFLKK